MPRPVSAEEAALARVAAAAVEAVEPQRRGMAVTRSFGTPVTDLDTLMGAVAQYAMRGGEKLRSHGLVSGQLTVFFHTNPHRRDLAQHHGSRRINLHPMTADSLELVAAARPGVEAAWRDGLAYTKAGIMPDDLCAAELRPRTLFEGDVTKRERLMTAIDAVNGRYGRSAAVPAAQGFRREWKARSESKTPAWTTRIAEVPIMNA